LAAAPPSESPSDLPLEPEAGAPRNRRTSDRVLRVTAENLNRLLSLAGESLVESRWAKPFTESLLRLKRQHRLLGKTLDTLRDASMDLNPDGAVLVALAEARRNAEVCQYLLAQRLTELELFDRRNINLAHRLYDEALACRMRPFADGVEGLPAWCAISRARSVAR
jgi:two-component system sensor histidine kinase and response regulator WspE